MTLVLVLLALSACVIPMIPIEWQQDAQGHITSVGLPGLPVWQASAQPTSAGTVVAAAQLSESQLGQAELTRYDGREPSAWLEELNYYRRAAGLSAVSENQELSRASLAHAQYLLSTAHQRATNVALYSSQIGGMAHSEDPSSPYFTQLGAEGAQGGPQLPGVMQSAELAFGEPTPVDDVDSLLVVPFHRLGLLAPWIEVASYGAVGVAPDRVAAIAMRGRQSNKPLGFVIKFPSDGAVVPFGTMAGGEWPDPLSSCPGYHYPVGLPVTLELPQAASLGSYSLSNASTAERLEACAFDAATFKGQESNGWQALWMLNATVMIPKKPLEHGQRYRVAIEAGARYEWTFSVRQ